MDVAGRFKDKQGKKEELEGLYPALLYDKMRCDIAAAPRRET